MEDCLITPKDTDIKVVIADIDLKTECIYENNETR